MHWMGMLAKGNYRLQRGGGRVVRKGLRRKARKLVYMQEGDGTSEGDA